MSSGWFLRLQRALAAASIVSRYAKSAARLVAYWMLLDERREAERLRNEAARIRNLESYASALNKIARTLKAHGANHDVVLRAAVQLLVHELEGRADAAQVAQVLIDQPDSGEAPLREILSASSSTKTPTRRAGDRAS
jgi:hypothetical protein